MLFAPPQPIETEVWLSLPDSYRRRSVASAWGSINKVGQAVDSFLEGPSFDRAGNLWFVDIPFGRIFRASPAGEVELIAEYDGEPNGLKIHRDGRVFIADYARGIMQLDPATGSVTPWCTRFRLEAFKGCNDLVFASNGDMFFTDQGQTGHQDPTGRVFRLTTDGRLDCLIDRVPSPNGIVLDRHERTLYVAVTRANAVWRLPIMPDGHVSKVGTFIQLSGGHGGPDGLALTDEGGLVVAHAGLGCVWVLDPLGQPLYRVSSCRGINTTNIAFGGEGNRTLFITESESGTILKAELPLAGQVMYGLS